MRDDFVIPIDFDYPVASSDSDGFYFFVPRRLPVKLCRPLLEYPGLQIVPSDVWKLNSDDE